MDATRITTRLGDRAWLRLILTVGVGLAGAALSGWNDQAWATRVETWRQETAATFAKGKKERVVVSDTGRVRLGRPIKPTGPLDASRVWDLIRTRTGDLYAATGDRGRVYRRVAGTEDWRIAHEAADTQCLALVVLADGTVLVGTGPSGKVVSLQDSKTNVTTIDPGVKYIWDLAADSEGHVYAATGPEGQLWKRDLDGSWSKVLESRHAHLLTVVVGRDGSIFTGSDGDGVIYRLSSDGKVSVVYDAPQSEIRSLLMAPDGSLYAGTASAESSTSGNGSNRGISSLNLPRPFLEAAAFRPSIRHVIPISQSKKSESEASGPPGTARLRPSAANENVVYRISSDGAVREVFRARVLMNALAWHENRLYVGTGPEGELFELVDGGREATPVARLDHGQILALLPVSEGELLLGASDPGAVLTLGTGHVGSGTLTSEVLDAKLISRFGNLTWQAERPPGTAIGIQIRTGNVGEPDETWSSWSAPYTDPSRALAQVPSGRFAQYRAVLATDNPKATPELRSVSIRYQTLNLAPEVSKIEVPDLSEADGTTRQASLTVRWVAMDPNEDDLTYHLEVRKDGWPEWIRLGEKAITDKTYNWDTTSVPSGLYRVRVTASDRPSNSPEEALARTRVSEPFLIDHQPPQVSVTRDGKAVKAALHDEHTRLTRAAFALDAGEWTPVFPDDGLFDSPQETITIPLGDQKPGMHVLMIKTNDAAGNTGAQDVVFEIR